MWRSIQLPLSPWQAAMKGVMFLSMHARLCVCVNHILPSAYLMLKSDHKKTRKQKNLWCQNVSKWLSQSSWTWGKLLGLHTLGHCWRASLLICSHWFYHTFYSFSMSTDNRHVTIAGWNIKVSIAVNSDTYAIQKQTQWNYTHISAKGGLLGFFFTFLSDGHTRILSSVTIQSYCTISLKIVLSCGYSWCLYHWEAHANTHNAQYQSKYICHHSSFISL